MAMLTQAQRWADGPQNQSATAQSLHAMTGAGGDRSRFIAAANDYYDYCMRAAILEQRAGNTELAMRYLGIALHISQDATSPSHEGAQEYHGSSGPAELLKDVSDCARYLHSCGRAGRAIAHGLPELFEPSARSHERDLLDGATRRTFDEFEAGVNSGAREESYRAMDATGMIPGERVEIR